MSKSKKIPSILMAFVWTLAILTFGLATCFAQINGNFQAVRLTLPSTDSSRISTNNGTIWYNPTSNRFRFRQNGSWISFVPTGNAYWALASGGTLTGLNTISSGGVPNRLLFNSTWTATSNNDTEARFYGTFTSRTTAADVLSPYVFAPSITGGASNRQFLSGMTISPAFTGGADNTDVASALDITPGYTGTFGGAFGVYVAGANTGQYQALKLVNTSTGSTMLTFTSASGAVKTSSSHAYFERANGTNGAFNIVNTGTGQTTFSNPRVTMTPNATYSGLNVGSLAGNPSTLTDGDVWYNSSVGSLIGRINGTSYGIFAGNLTTGLIPWTASPAQIMTGSANLTITSSGAVFTHNMADINGKTDTPSALGASQNNYTLLNNAYVNRLSSSVASVDITGITAETAGSTHVIVNIGTSNNIVLRSENASSTASNRFSLAADITLAPKNSAIIWYDSGLSRWICLAKN